MLELCVMTSSSVFISFQVKEIVTVIIIIMTCTKAVLRK